ncbi:hypothetical protein [Paenibacillus sp. SI8]|uniref:hypothetical protein n=1 Tax=unclassified Paenibacillus TaxID=185978 RepID=UPI0034658535
MGNPRREDPIRIAQDKVPFLRRVGQFTVRARWFVILVGVLALVVSGVIGAGTVGKLSLSRWEVPGSESYRAGK